MTDFPEDLFTQVYRRAPNDEDRQRLVGIKAGLGLSPRDEMWPLIIVLDQYERSIRAGRAATTKEITDLIKALKDIPEKAGPIANAAAQKSIAQLIQQASSKIAEESAKRSITTADRITNRQFIVAAIAGGIIATVVAAGGAAAMYFMLHARGICAEPPGPARDGSKVCFVERASS